MESKQVGQKYEEEAVAGEPLRERGQGGCRTGRSRDAWHQAVGREMTCKPLEARMWNEPLRSVSSDFLVAVGWGACLSLAVPWDPDELCQLTKNLLKDSDEGGFCV